MLQDKTYSFILSNGTGTASNRGFYNLQFMQLGVNVRISDWRGEHNTYEETRFERVRRWIYTSQTFGLFIKWLELTSDALFDYPVYLIVIFVGLFLCLVLGVMLSAWCCRGSFENPLCIPCYLCACCGGLGAFMVCACLKVNDEWGSFSLPGLHRLWPLCRGCRKCLMRHVVWQRWPNVNHDNLLWTYGIVIPLQPVPMRKLGHWTSDVSNFYGLIT